MRRSWSAAVGLAALLALVLSGPVVAQPALTEVLMGNLSPSASEWPIYIADEQGFFKEQGLKVTIIAGGGPTNVINALASGGTQVADDGTDSYIAAVAHGLPIKMVMPQFQTMPYQLVVQPTITSWAQLKGKNIDLGTKKDVTAIAFYKMAEDHGLKDTDFSLIVGGNSGARYEALLGNRVEGSMLSQPFDLLANSKGKKTLASGSDYFRDNWMFTAMAVNTNWAAKNRPIVVKMIKAFRKAIAFGYTHKAQTVTALVNAARVDRAIAEQAYDLDFGKWKAFDRQQRVNFPAVRNIANILVADNDISTVPTMDQLFDMSYVAEAAKP
jgi:ABC-type nitrate/sulfonate/bicarbonate transport system substrate-binding protein